MRILFLQDHLRIGGTERQTLALARYGMELGHETGVVVFRPGGALEPEPGDFAFFRELQPFNTRIDEWAPGLSVSIRTFKPDLLVFMGKVSHLYLNRIRRYFPQLTLVSTFRSGKVPATYYLNALHAADGVIVNSHAERKRLHQRWGIRNESMVTVHNGCLLREPPEKTHPPEKNKIRLLCTAMFRPQKNQMELLEILSQLPRGIDWQCTLAGSGRMLKPCQTRARALGLAERVRFVRDADTRSLYAEHDAAVLTSDKESLPNSLIEAQYCGLPVIAYLVNGVAECFDEGVSGFGIPFGKQEAFRDAMHLLALDPERRRRMGEAAARFGRENFDFKARSADFFEALREFHESRGLTSAH